MSFPQFCVYFTVGIVVGLITVGARELCALLLPSDTATDYSISVIAAYALGILLNFVLQRRITFSQRTVDDCVKTFASFIMVALIGGLATWMMSLAFRYAFQFDSLFGRYGATAAFALAAVCASAITYSLSATLVFRSHGDRSA